MHCSLDKIKTKIRNNKEKKNMKKIVSLRNVLILVSSRSITM
jgi:hypothetical protein